MTDSLSSHYEFWDNFVSDWRNGKYAEAEHLPEPWWGWCPDDGVLHSVTLNLSPGQGGTLQTRHCIGCAAGCCNIPYSVMMYEDTLRRHLSPTEKWHLTNRYQPLMRAIGVDEKNIEKDTKHHLSIELRPFHDEGSNDAYLETHRKTVAEHALLFAAEAAKLIELPKTNPAVTSQVTQPLLSLKNIVIVRSAIKNIKEYLGPKQTWKDIIEIDKNQRDVIVDEREFPVFRLSSKKEEYSHVSDVVFVCISGARNMLVKKDTLRKIIEQTNNHINKLK